MSATVVAVCRSASHSFRKEEFDSIRLLAGLGVEGDTHLGEKVQHRSRVAKNPDQPNLRQVHLIHAELFEELGTAGFEVSQGQLGENITTQGINLLGLPKGSHLQLGIEAVVEITGLRNPCAQLDNFQKGLTAAVLDRDTDGKLVRKAGVMAVVVASGIVKSGDFIHILTTPEPHVTLIPV